MRIHLASTCSLAIVFLLSTGCANDGADGAGAGAGGSSAGDDAGSGGDDATTDAGDDASPAGDGSSGDATVDGAQDGEGDDAGDAAIEAGPTADGSADASSDASADASQPIEAGPPDAGDAGAPSDGGTDGSADQDASSLPPLLGAWSFDEGSGTSSADLSGNGHPATLEGGASWGAGKQAGGLALDGASGYADVGVTLIDTTRSFTVVAWAKLASVSQWEAVASEDDVTGSLFGLKLRGDGTNHFDFDVETTDTTNPGFVVAQSTSTAQAGAWVHLAGVYDASGSGSLAIFVDGVREAKAAVGQAVLPASGHFLLGRGLYNGVTGSFLNGTLDDVAVYDGALTDAQVAAIYAAQK